jgi:hypothetical protein
VKNRSHQPQYPTSGDLRHEVMERTNQPQYPASVDVRHELMERTYQPQYPASVDVRHEVMNRSHQPQYPGKVEGENVTYREVITANIESVKKFRFDIKEHLDKLNVLRDRQKELEAKKSRFTDGIPRNYHNEDDLV